MTDAGAYLPDTSVKNAVNQMKQKPTTASILARDCITAVRTAMQCTGNLHLASVGASATEQAYENPVRSMTTCLTANRSASECPLIVNSRLRQCSALDFSAMLLPLALLRVPVHVVRLARVVSFGNLKMESDVGEVLQQLAISRATPELTG